LFFDFFILKKGFGYFFCNIYRREKSEQVKKYEKIEILKEFFWDYKWESVREKMDSPFVISRVLQKVIGKQKIKNFLKKYENLLSEQSQNFYKLCYGVKSKKTFNRTLKSS
jgi:hypothetical protein